MQPLMKLKQELANRLSNPGTNGVLSVVPFLRFLPLPMSSVYHEAKSVHQQHLDTLEMLSVMYILSNFKTFTWINYKCCDMSFCGSLILLIKYHDSTHSISCFLFIFYARFIFIFFSNYFKTFIYFTKRIFVNSRMTNVYRYMCLLNTERRFWKDRNISFYERGIE